MTPASDSKIRPASVALPFAYPLDEFYALASRELPPIEQVAAEAVPEPYHHLLVHHLAAHHLSRSDELLFPGDSRALFLQVRSWPRAA